jgi:hypothetical protein
MGDGMLEHFSTPTRWVWLCIVVASTLAMSSCNRHSPPSTENRLTIVIDVSTDAIHGRLRTESTPLELLRGVELTTVATRKSSVNSEYLKELVQRVSVSERKLEYEISSGDVHLYYIAHNLKCPVVLILEGADRPFINGTPGSVLELPAGAHGLILDRTEPQPNLLHSFEPIRPEQ